MESKNDEGKGELRNHSHWTEVLENILKEAKEDSKKGAGRGRRGGR
ncbi:MAG: hypothetical protein QW292_09325 [Candidatus Parvarchaeota archaeon]